MSLNPSDKVLARRVHKRLKRKYGHASSKLCIDCGGKADDWSFNKNKGFSENLKLYKTRCRSCHRKKDAKGNKNSLGYKHPKEFGFLLSKRMRTKKNRAIIAASNRRRKGEHRSKEWIKESLKYRDKKGRFTKTKWRQFAKLK